MSLTLVTAPASEPVIVNEVKSHARIETSADDTLLGVYITAAREAAEAYLARAIMPQTWKLIMDDWPTTQNDAWWDGVREGPISMFYGDAIELPLGPAISVAHIKTYAVDNTPTTLAGAAYTLDKEGARIFLNDGYAWPMPGRRYAGIEVQWQCGYADAAAVPASIKHGLKLHVAYLYEHRGEEQLDLTIPPQARAFYDSKRLISL